MVSLTWNSRLRFSSASLSAGVGPSKTRLKAATEVSAQKGFRTIPGLDPALWIYAKDEQSSNPYY